MSYAKLSPKAFGLAFGTLWALIVVIMGIVAHFHPVGVWFVNSVKALYVGYEMTWMGVLIGTVMAFVHLFVKGFFLGAFYNFFNK
jgi:hypothetical protein